MHARLQQWIGWRGRTKRVGGMTRAGATTAEQAADPRPTTGSRSSSVSSVSSTRNPHTLRAASKGSWKLRAAMNEQTRSPPSASRRGAAGRGVSPSLPLCGEEGGRQGAWHQASASRAAVCPPQPQHCPPRAAAAPAHLAHRPPRLAGADALLRKAAQRAGAQAAQEEAVGDGGDAACGGKGERVRDGLEGQESGWLHVLRG